MTLIIKRTFTVSVILPIYMNFLSNSSTVKVINIGLLNGDKEDSLQAKRLLTIFCCSGCLSTVPDFTAIPFARDFESMSTCEKPAPGTSFSRSESSCSNKISTSLSEIKVGIPLISTESFYIRKYKSRLLQGFLDLLEKLPFHWWKTEFLTEKQLLANCRSNRNILK